MPPADKPQPSDEERRLLEDWIKYGAFGIDPKDPDPGRVTVRRLNRVEYRNTIRDLMGVDFDTDSEFPPDDTGHGFDNIGDVLTLSPLLLEKYIAAANDDRRPGRADRAEGRRARRSSRGRASGRRRRRTGGGRPAVAVLLQAGDGLGHGPGRARRPLPAGPGPDGERAFVDGVNRLQPVPARLQGRRRGARPSRVRPAGRQAVPLRVRPGLEGRAARADGRGRAADAGREAGPVADAPDRSRRPSAGRWTSEYWVRPPNYERFFPGEVPDDADGRRRVRPRAPGPVRRRRRSAAPWTTRRWTGSRRWPRPSRRSRGRPSRPASPRRWRPCWPRPGSCSARRRSSRARRAGIRSVDEYALASRLSYFLWSSMPDDELIRLAGEHKLRANLPAQVERMLADPRSEEFVRHFVGQWLQARDIETVLDQRPRRDLPRRAARPRGGAAAGAVPGADPQAARGADRRREEGAAGGPRDVRPGVPPLPRVRADRRPAPGDAARDRDALRAHRPRTTAACWS